MNLSFKDLRFIREAIENQINAYQERLQVIEYLEENEDKAADLGNDLKFLELLHRDITKTLEQNSSVRHLSSDDRLLLDANDTSSENSKDISFQTLVKLSLKLSISERLFLVDAITASVRQELTISQ
jgi:hypothetical protein